MATNMIELMAILRDKNRPSSSFTLLPEHRPTVDPNQIVPPIYVTDSEDVSFLVMTYVPVVHPVSDPLPLPPAPTTVSLPPTAFLSMDSTMHALPPLAMPVHPPIYTVPPPTVPPDSLTGSALDWFMTLKAGDVPTWTDLSQKFLDQYRFCLETPPTLLDLSMTEMREGQTFEAYATEWRGKVAKHIPPITERQQVQLFHSMLRGAYYSHLLAHTSSFLDLIEAGKKLDIGVKLGRIEDPSRKKDRETSKRQTTRSSRKTYAHPVHYTQLYPAQQAYSPALPTVIQSQPPHQYASVQVQQGRAPTSRSPQPAQRAPTPQAQQGGAAQPRQRKQYTSLPTLPSHIFRQLLVGNKIRTEALSPNFDPTVQNQNLRCEFHQGAPGHTLDTCWRLWDRIQEMINTKQISFNEVKPLNVRVSPLPNHGSSSGSSSNMISIAAIGEEEDLQETPVLFIIDYAPVEVAVTYAPLVIEVPAKEPYQDHRVPWDYGGDVANMEHEMSAMSITRSGRVYQGLEPTNKGKAPIVAFSTISEAASHPTKKVVEQMGKSPAHISLLALLLSSEPHRDALLKVLTAAQVPKETTPDRIEETVNSIFSNQISFAEDELPFEGQGHLWALHIVCKCNNHVIGRVMIDNGSALNVCPISMLKQMNVDMGRIRASKTIVRAFDGSKREVNEKSIS
ncbi:hypothetical protein CRG98_037605 [Punica granatum]|uniref:Retrotransposon gag domain-containing protein n=1 Tax=Punica granatum TaxID=22663 RepID=A0A2I0IDC0_PUNGR|nr:hypothetical protein CRG98_037605 [Punica granatum]